MWMRDTLQELFVDEDFADWYSADGRPGISPARLAIVSVLQFAENLTDRQAARAVACRIDRKYALGMRLGEPGFDHSVLSEFRDRLAEGDRADQLLAVMVDRLAAAGLIKPRGRQRTDSTHVLAAVRKLSRIELFGETMRVALEAVANLDEKWLAALLTPEWATLWPARRLSADALRGGRAGRVRAAGRCRWHGAIAGCLSRRQPACGTAAGRGGGAAAGVGPAVLA